MVMGTHAKVLKSLLLLMTTILLFPSLASAQTPTAQVEWFTLQYAAIERSIGPKWSNGTTTVTLEPWTEPVPGGASGYHLSFGSDLYFSCSGGGVAGPETCEVVGAYTFPYEPTQGTMEISRNFRTPGDAILELNITRQGTYVSSVTIGLGTKEIVEVFITQPKTGATVSGTVWVVMWVEGTSGASNVFTLSADGKQIDSQTRSSHGPVTMAWPTKPVGAPPVPNGTHTLTGTVRDVTGNTRTTSITVILKN